MRAPTFCIWHSHDLFFETAFLKGTRAIAVPPRQSSSLQLVLQHASATVVSPHRGLLTRPTVAAILGTARTWMPGMSRLLDSGDFPGGRLELGPEALAAASELILTR